MHDSSEILHICNSCYKQEVEHVRQHFQQQYQNWIPLDGLKSRWWILNNIVKEISISMRYIHSYLESMHSSKYQKLIQASTQQGFALETFIQKDVFNLYHSYLLNLILQGKQPALTDCASHPRSCSIALESLTNTAQSAWFYITNWWTAQKLKP